jgi:hypothetical protein
MEPSDQNPDPAERLVDDETRRTEDEDARVTARADRRPTPEEERRAEESDLDPSVAEHYREMTEIGAEVKGEGSISGG